MGYNRLCTLEIAGVFSFLFLINTVNLTFRFSEFYKAKPKEVLLGRKNIKMTKGNIQRKKKKCHFN